MNLKWLRKWSYLALLLGTGMIYLTCVDGWKVYAKPLEQAREWYEECRKEGILAVILGNGGQEQDDGDGLSGEGNPTGDMAEGDGSDSHPERGDDPYDIVSGETEGDSSGSGNSAGVPGGGSGNSPGAPGGGSGNSAGVPGGGSGNSPGVPGGGSGNSSGVPGGGSGNSAGVPGEPVYVTVEDDYFADAVFIGDSRTVGMFEYAGLEETATFYASKGLTVYRLFDSEIVDVPGERKKITVEEALQQNSFAKIYLMIGINEMGTGTVDSFIEKYQEVVAHLRELQPDAILYLQAIIKVTTERSDQGDYINNEGIVARNERIAQMADNQKIFYLDVNPYVCDETGGMVPEYTFDGVHLKAKYIDIWKDFLKTHAIWQP